MRHLVSAMLLVVALIHLLPLSGVLGGARLRALYDVTIDDPSLAIMMRHRAVLFGLLGAFLVYAAFREELQILGFFAGFVSVISFLLLAWATGGFNASLRRVVVADVIALVCLVIGAVVRVCSSRA